MTFSVPSHFVRGFYFGVLSAFHNCLIMELLQNEELLQMDFYQTRGGRKYYENHVPRIANALDTIAHELKRSNDIIEGKHLKRIADELVDVEPAMARLIMEYTK